MIPLSTMAAPLTALWAMVPLSDQAPDPADVKPGWLGFGVFLLLAAAVVVLWFSFRKQLRKVDFEEPGQEETGESGESRSDAPGEATSNGDTASNGDTEEGR